mgnify:CR=1 FL=1
MLVGDDQHRSQAVETRMQRTEAEAVAWERADTLERQ